jgi:KUP system potassium uptake protein
LDALSRKAELERMDMGPEPREQRHSASPLNVLTALGVVFGDLGTSPLYAMQTVAGALGGKFTTDTALGVLSLIVWTLLLTISVKYCLLVMRADNHGEGGILALMSLVGANRLRGGAAVLTLLGLLGTGLIFGDGTITPAISVLSALEGLTVVSNAFKPFVMPLGGLILLMLFMVQRLGTDRIGRGFGPVMLLWFGMIAFLGLRGVLASPAVLSALNPAWGIHYLVHAGVVGPLVLGGVFLCITGGEALYADMGHVGKRAIRIAWYGLVLPALLLNYAGQTALLISGPPTQMNPFFLLVPRWAVYPVVALATLATIIASQSIITGAFSMTRQAIQLHWLPPVPIRQTSDRVYGQIYIPIVNWLMMATTLAIVTAFKSSDRLAGAYGTAVSTTMLITTVLLTAAMFRVWRWPIAASGVIAGIFIVTDLAFFGANLLKIREGGWLPLILGTIVLAIMISWRSGINALHGTFAKSYRGLVEFAASIDDRKITRTEGSAIFLTRVPRRVPRLVTDYLEFTGSLQRTVAIVSVHFEETPRVDESRRIEADEVEPDLWCATVHFGFVEIPDVDAAIRRHKSLADAIDIDRAVYFGARDLVLGRRGSRSLSWRLTLFAFLYRNAQHVMDRFHLPPGRVLELAREIEI